MGHLSPSRFGHSPCLYAREGDVANLEGIPEIYAKVVSRVPDSQVNADYRPSYDETAAWEMMLTFFRAHQL